MTHVLVTLTLLTRNCMVLLATEIRRFPNHSVHLFTSKSNCSMYLHVYYYVCKCGGKRTTF